jgi:hypothetical protein
MRSGVDGSKAQAESIDDGERRPEATNDRRHVLKALGVVAAGVVAGGVLSTKEAQAHGSFHEESNNGDPAIHGDNTNGGAGVMGTSLTAWGVDGQCDNGTGVRGRSQIGNGVHGTSPIGTGVAGSSDTGTGVSGTSDTDGVTGTSNNGAGTGVRGDSHGVNGIGVAGHSDPGTGVQGNSETGTGTSGFSSSGIGVKGNSVIATGVHGESDGGTGVHARSQSGPGIVGESIDGPGVVAFSFASDALQVSGPARFTTAGSGVIPAGQSSRFVSNPAVTPQSHITVTLTGNPGVPLSGFPIVIHWVQRQLGGFVIHMTRAVGPSTPFTYLIVEPG